MIAFAIAAAALVATAAAQPVADKAMTPAERLDLRCAATAGMVMRDLVNENSQLSAFSVTTFYFGRLSGRDPVTDWGRMSVAEARTLVANNQDIGRDFDACAQQMTDHLPQQP